MQNKQQNRKKQKLNDQLYKINVECDIN